MDLATIRNIGIAAHIDAGKTTVTEQILFCSGVEHRVGHVDEGTAVMDYMPEERERGITITAAATRVPWRGYAFNLIDTPGHVDFTVEVERCMRVLDGAVLVIDAVAGVQAQSETVWRQIRRHTIPSIAFVNKCDRVGADFMAAVESLRTRLEAPAQPLQYPWYEDEHVVGVVDLLELRAWRFRADDCAPIEAELPEELRVEAEVLRSELLDVLGDRDDEILQAVLEERDLAPDTLRSAIRRCVLAGTLQPVFCGAALRGIGTQPLMDAIVDYLPSPLDRTEIVAHGGEADPERFRGGDPDAALAALAFKITTDEHGSHTFARIYSGRLRSGEKLWNPRERKQERVARILRMHANAGESLDEAVAGDIVALTGLKFTGTGDTLCRREAEILLEPPVFPEPVIALVVEPAGSEDRERLGHALARLGQEDPSLHVVEDTGTGQWRLEGMGELHLEVVVHRLQEEFGLDARVGQPRVSYREAIRGKRRARATVDRPLGGHEVHAEVELEVAPAAVPEAGDGPAERSASPIEWADGLQLSDGARKALEEALVSEAQSGPRFGFPLVGVRVLVLAARSKEGYESDQAYAMAGTQALRQALAESDVQLLEPTMRFEIHSPEEFASGIIADLGARHAEVGEVLAEGDARIVRGSVPLFQMFGYSTVVRSLSQGRAGFSMRPSGFQPVSEDEQRARGLVWG